jgi:hypothetical protein
VFVAKGTDRIGKRTDILLISRWDIHDTARILAEAPHVVWMSPNERDCLSRKQTQGLYFYPLEWWGALRDELGHRPSTGCSGIDLVSKLVGTGRIHLYGYDFWRTPTTYTGGIRPGPHNPQAEEQFARKRVPHAFE